MGISQSYVRKILDAALAYKQAYESIRLEVQNDCAHAEGSREYCKGMYGSIYMHHYPVDPALGYVLDLADQHHKHTAARNARQRRYLAKKKLANGVDSGE